MIIRRIGLATALAASLLAVTAPAPAATSSAEQRKAPQPLQTQAVFNVPGTGEKTRIFKHLKYLIDGAAYKSKIRVAMYRWDGEEGDWIYQIVKALINAHEHKKVTVQVLVDAIGRKAPPYKRLEKELGKNDSDESWTRFCGDTGVIQPGKRQACIGENPEGQSSMHNKFFLFTRTRGVSWVVSNGSSNMTPKMADMWNSQYTVVNNQTLYDRYLGYFKDLVRQKKDPNYYAKRPPQPGVPTTSYHYPRESGDTVVQSLKEVSCPRTSIRIGVWALTRKPVAEELKAKAAEGCRIQIIANRIGELACKVLVSNRLIEIRSFSKAKGPGVHQKNILIDGHYLQPGTKAVFTGSPNLDWPSLLRGDENVIRTLNDQQIYRQFLDNFERMHRISDERIFTVADCAKVKPPE